MATREVLTDKRTIEGAMSPGVAHLPGDLMYWDNTLKYARKASTRADLGSLAANQADFSFLFYGVAGGQRLVGETSVAGRENVRLLVFEGIFDCDCAALATTAEVGDPVGIDRTTAPLNSDSQVIRVADVSLAIGKVVKRAAVGATVMRCWLSAYEYGYAAGGDNPRLGAVNAVTAFAGGGQGSATPLTAAISRITVCATINDSVRLPRATPGQRIAVHNLGAATANVFPSVGDAINALAVNTALAVATSKGTFFDCAVAGFWNAIQSA